MCADGRLYIDDVIQNVRIDVDEEGTSAAAATVLVIEAYFGYGETAESVEMNVNRPFIIVIGGEDGGINAFAAVVAEV